MAKNQIEALQQQLREKDEEIAARDAEQRRLRDLASAREVEIKQTREQFNDLKTRIQAAETANQFMRGYLARVQEDDVVREELVTTGEPGGEQQMVPKRKPTHFSRMDDYTVFGDRDGSSPYHGFGMTSEERSRRRKHWITY